METLGTILGFVIALILFGIKNWADLKKVKKTTRQLLKYVEEAQADDTISDEEKQKIAEKTLLVLNNLIPVLASVWKFNWGANRRLEDLFNSSKKKKKKK